MTATLSERSMTPFMTGRRMVFAVLTLIAACRGSADAQDQRRGLFTPSAAGTIRPVVAKHGKPDIAKSRDSLLGIGIPGTVAELALALQEYSSGKFTLAEILKPAEAGGN